MPIRATYAPGSEPTDEPNSGQRSYLKYAAMGVFIASIIFGSLLIHFSAAASTTTHIGAAFIGIPLYLLFLSYIRRQLAKENQMLKPQTPISVVLAQPVSNVLENAPVVVQGTIPERGNEASDARDTSIVVELVSSEQDIRNQHN